MVRAVLPTPPSPSTTSLYKIMRAAIVAWRSARAEGRGACGVGVLLSSGKR